MKTMTTMWDGFISQLISTWGEVRSMWELYILVLLKVIMLLNPTFLPPPPPSLISTFTADVKMIVILMFLLAYDTVHIIITFSERTCMESVKGHWKTTANGERPGESRFAIQCSPRHSPFAAPFPIYFFQCSLFKVRYSMFAAPFAIRRAVRHSPRHSPRRSPFASSFAAPFAVRLIIRCAVRHSLRRFLFIFSNVLYSSSLFNFSPRRSPFASSFAAPFAIRLIIRRAVRHSPHHSLRR